MAILKENEVIMSNDIYFFQIVNNTIIVNNNYDGILILNSVLKVVKQIDIYQEFCVYNAIVLNDDEVLFNCIENNMFFVVNIDTGEIKKCEIPKILVKDILMKKLKIDGKHVVFKTYKNHFWDLDLQKMNFTECDNIVFTDQYEECCENSNLMKIENSTICMNEHNILVCDNETKYNILPQNGYRFLRIGSIYDNLLFKLIVLSGSDDNETSMLTSYCFN